MKQYSKEMYEAMSYFERNVGKMVYCGGSFDKEPKELWTKGRYYRNGETNKFFLVFLWGIGYGEAEAKDRYEHESQTV